MRNRRPAAAEPPSGFRRVTSKGQITIPSAVRRRYNITTHTRLQFIPQSGGFLVAPAVEEGAFKELAGSASRHWTVDEMLRRLDQLRKENV
jgi:AbrB family looped-hinge helix DNA binding protein